MTPVPAGTDGQAMERLRVDPFYREAVLADIDALSAERDRLRGWPDFPGLGPSLHSPVDSYRCENPECEAEYEMWQFRPDDHDLDESAVLCPTCGQEGELFFRRFRGGPAAVSSSPATTETSET